MATVRLRIPIDPTWSPTDRLRLRVGTPGAASLAASTPSGGEVVTEQSPWPTSGGSDRGGLGAGGLGLGGLGFSAPGAGYGLGQGELGVGTLGAAQTPRAALERRLVLAAGQRCLTVPIGADVMDAPGNVAAVIERQAPLNDAPRGVRDLRANAGGTGGVALTWSASADVF